ncbi:MAG: glycosyltransferase [Deltaproteobacteria bacterium]|nr:glycosyltransferase [Deltaproteobacteria bacterium]
MPSVSVIIGTYNQLPYLKLCMLSLERQTFGDFEVIVADDGSGPEVGEWLRTYRPSYPVKHLWQEDKGFRKCRILNRVILESKAGYIVFIDADCILARDFLQAHWEHRKENVFLGGRRVMMGVDTSAGVGSGMVVKGYFDGPTLWGVYHSLLGHFKYYEETLRPLHRLRRNNRFNLLGCNFSIHKTDLFAVNGFDEDYQSRGGGEDTDISYRLKAAGKMMESVRYIAIQFHLGHKTSEGKDQSARMFSEKRKRLLSAEDARNIKSLLAGKESD